MRNEPSPTTIFIRGFLLSMLLGIIAGLSLMTIYNTMTGSQDCQCEEFYKLPPNQKLKA